MTMDKRVASDAAKHHIKQTEMSELEHHQLTVLIDALHDLYYALLRKGLLPDGVTPPESS